MFRTQYLPARQIGEQLSRFVRLHEVPSNENSLASALSDAGFVLLKLKEQLMYVSGFGSEFSRSSAGGMDVLVRALVVLQRLHSQPAGNRLGALVNRSLNSRKRKAAVAEADCLECIKLLLEKTSAWATILDFAGNVELILFSLNSPQLDSKCYALEISTMLVRQPSGFLQLLRSLTVTAASNRDENRLTPIVGQLKHGLHTGKLHIQVLVVRFLNVLRQQAANENYALLVQIEAENAGFSADRLERVVREQGARSGVDTLQRELALWRQAYTPVTVLDARRTLAGSVRPSIYMPDRNTNRLNSYDEGEETDGDSWRGRNRLYEMQTAMRTNSRVNATAPVERQRARREPEQLRRSTLDLTPLGSQQQYNRSSDSLAQQTQQTSNTQRRPSRYSRSDSLPQQQPPVQRARSEGSMHKLVQQQGYDSQAPARRHAQFRSASVTPMESRARDAEQQFGGSGGRSGHNRRISRSVHDLARISEEGSRPSSSQEQRWVPLKPIEPVTWADGSRMTLNMAIPDTHTSLSRLAPPADDEDYDDDDDRRGPPPPPRPPSVPPPVELVRSLPQQNGVEVDIVERRSPRSPGAVKMQGFSYLFPKRPVVDNLPVRNSSSDSGVAPLPSRVGHQRQYSRSRTPDVHQQQQQQQQQAVSGTGSTTSSSVRPRVNRRLSSETDQASLGPSTSVSQRGSGAGQANVVYIPVRVQPGGGGSRARHNNLHDPDDVNDALSKFDYLNEYETSSRGSRF